MTERLITKLIFITEENLLPIGFKFLAQILQAQVLDSVDLNKTLAFSLNPFQFYLAQFQDLTNNNQQSFYTMP
jgi:hypothetical protein